MLSGTLLGTAIMSAARRLRVLDRSAWVRAVTLTLLLWAPATVMTWLAIGLVSGGNLALANLYGNAGSVLLVSAAMTALNFLADRTPPETHARAENAAPASSLSGCRSDFVGRSFTPSRPRTTICACIPARART